MRRKSGNSEHVDKHKDKTQRDGKWPQTTLTSQTKLSPHTNETCLHQRALNECLCLNYPNPIIIGGLWFDLSIQICKQGMSAWTLGICMTSVMGHSSDSVLTRSLWWRVQRPGHRGSVLQDRSDLQVLAKKKPKTFGLFSLSHSFHGKVKIITMLWTFAWSVSRVWKIKVQIVSSQADPQQGELPMPPWGGDGLTWALCYCREEYVSLMRMHINKVQTFWDKGMWTVIFKGRYTNRQWSMQIIRKIQTSFHTCQKAIIKKTENNECWGECVGKGALDFCW